VYSKLLTRVFLKRFGMTDEVLVRSEIETDVATLRWKAGQWLRLKRENLGLSQRDLAKLVNVEYYTFISQIEAGRGRVPPDRLIFWARALEVDPREFATTLMQFYDPHTYRLVFQENNERID
jgi:transcriptional regulator with XRE-family HTH domain